ncbi:MAG: glycosyltransferase [Ignavibacteriaceae bacterium]|nr:glycosyltransferase [Ignavibacteriaceae bacterium]
MKHNNLSNKKGDQGQELSLLRSHNTSFLTCVLDNLNKRYKYDKMIFFPFTRILESNYYEKKIENLTICEDSTSEDFNHTIEKNKNSNYDLAIISISDNLDKNDFCNRIKQLLQITREVLIINGEEVSDNLKINKMISLILTELELEFDAQTYTLSKSYLVKKKGTTRISLITPTSKLHGGTKVIIEHANYLSSKGNLVNLISFDKNKPEWEELDKNIKFYFAPNEKYGFVESIPDADIIIATLWITSFLIASCPIEKGEKYYFIQGYESVWSELPELVDESYDSLSLKKIVVSSYLKEILKEKYNQDAILSLNGIDFCEPEFAKTSKKDYKLGNSIRIGMLYNEASVKSFLTGYEAFHIVKEKYPNVKLILYGAKKLHKTIVCDEFYFLPSRKELSNIYSSLDLFVFSSISEGFGLPLLESMAHGIPSAITDFGGYSDFADNNSVLISPIEKPKLLANNIIKLIESEELREKIGKNSFLKSHNFSKTNASKNFEIALQRKEFQKKSLKILFVGAGPVWADAFLDPFLISGLTELGHSVTVFQPKPQNWMWEKQFVNYNLLKREKAEFLEQLNYPEDLIEEAKRLNPDLIFFNHALLINSSILDELRKCKIPTAIWMIDEPQEMEFSINRGLLFDYVFLQDRASLKFHFEKGNPKTFSMPHGIDPIIHRSKFVDREIKKSFLSDILIIGTGFPERRRIVQSIAKLNYKIRVVGRSWEGLESPNIKIQEPVTFEEAAKLYRGAKITINIHRKKDDLSTSSNIPDPLSPNGSYFYISGCGSLQFVDKDFGGASDYLLPNKHYVVFNDEKDLIEKLDYYLSNDELRESMAEEASKIIHLKHKYSDHLRTALSNIGKPISHKRNYSVSKKSFAPHSMFNFNGVVPIISLILYSDNIDKLKVFLARFNTVRKENFDIIVYHNNDDEIIQFLDKYKILHYGDKKRNSFKGFFSNCLAATDSDYLVFTTDNVILPINFVNRLKEILETNDKIGIVNAINKLPANIDYSSLEEFSNKTNRLYINYKGKFQESENVDLNVFAIRRELLEEIQSELIPFRNESNLNMGAFNKTRKLGLKIGHTLSVYYHDLASNDKLKDPCESKDISLVIPLFNNIKYTKLFFDSISKELLKDKIEIIFIDNNSTDETPEYLRKLQDTNPNVSVIFNKTNLGFPKAVNQGIVQSKGDYVLILNNDTVVTAGWLERMIEVAKSDPKIGIVGPISNEVSGLQKDNDAKYETIEEMHKYAAEVSTKNKGEVFNFPRVAFLCTLIKREVINEIGGLDERFSPGNYEDDDFCLRSQMGGYKTVIAKDVFIHHYGSKSFKANGIEAYRERLNINKQIFIEKWGATPDEIWINNKEVKPHQRYYPVNKNLFMQYFERTKIHLSDNEPLLAEEAIKSAIENYTNEVEEITLAELYNLAGNLSFANGNLESAKESYEKELNENPNSSGACFGLGQVFIASDELEGAKVMLEWAVKNDENNLQAAELLEKVNAALV